MIVVAACGTPAARKRHVENGTWPCRECSWRAGMSWHPRVRQDRLDADIRAAVAVLAAAFGVAP